MIVNQPEILRTFAQALQLSAHVLVQDPDQLTGQLTGRLSAASDPTITALVEQGGQKENTPWLRPLTAALAPPGGPLVRTLTGHSDRVEAVSLDRSGRLAASVSRDKTLRLWDLESGETQAILRADGDEWNAVALSPDGSRAVCQSSSLIGISLEIWDLAQGKSSGFLKTYDDASDLLSGRPQIAFLPDGCHLLATSNQFVELWDIGRRALVSNLGTHDQAIHSLAVARSGRLVATGAENEIKIWELDPAGFSQGQAGTLKHALASKAGSKTGGWSSDATPTALTFFQNDRKILAVFSNNILEVWDVETGQLVTYWRGPGDEFLAASDEIKTVAVSGDSNLAILGIRDGHILVQDLRNGNPRQTLAAHDEAVIALVSFPQGTGFLSASWDGSLKCWDLARLEAREDGQAQPGGKVQILASSPDGRYTLSTGTDRILRVWDPQQAALRDSLPVHTGQLYAVIGGYHLPQIVGGKTSDDSRMEAPPRLEMETGVRLSPEPRLLVWDAPSRRLVATLSGLSGWGKSLSFTNRPDWLLSLSQDHRLQLWDLDTGDVMSGRPWETLEIAAFACLARSYQAVVSTLENQVLLLDLDSGDTRRVGDGHQGAILSIAISPDDCRAVTASRDHTLMVWDLVHGGLLARLEGHSDEIESVAFSPGGRWAASGSADKTIILWDLYTYRLLRTLQGHSDRVRDLCFLPDGRLASGGLDGTVRIWEIPVGRMVSRHKVASDWVESLACSSVAGTLFSGSPDATISAWDLKNGTRQAVLTCDPFSRVTAMACHPDGHRLVTADGDPTLTPWRLPDGRGLTVLQTEWPELSPVIAVANQRAVFVHAQPDLQVLDLDRGVVCQTLTGHVHRVSAAAITSDSSLAVSGTEAGDLIVWDLEQGQAIHHLEYHADRIFQVAIPPGDTTCLTRSWQSLALWDLRSGQVLRTFPTGGNFLARFSLSPEGWQAAVCMEVSYNRQIVIWDLLSGANTPIGPLLQGFIYELKWLAGDRLLVSAGDAQVRIFNTTSGELDGQWRAGHSDAVWVSHLPGSSWVVSQGWEPTMRVWNSTRGERLCAFTADNDLTTSDLLPDGNTLVAGDKTGQVHFFALENFPKREPPP